MTPQRGKILEITEEALDLEGEERAAFVVERCGSDEPLLRAVQNLLAHSAADEEQVQLGENRRLLDRLERLVLDPHVAALDPSTLASPLETGKESSGWDRYTDIEEAGRGGMGVVRHVKDKRLGRQVALKRLRTDADGTGQGRSSLTAPRDLELFLREARVTAQLDHPGIVPIYELDVDAEGRPFFTMPFVRGRTLTDIIALARERKEGWSLPRALGVIQRVCETIAYAHSKGVVHRDIKPANILVGRFGEVYVMDWGVAHVMGRPDERSRLDDPRSTRIVASKDEGAPLLTLKGNVVGTPAYMSPEQARGEMELVDEQSDVYALGATLYNLLTGTAPYSHTRGRSLSREVLASILEGPPRAVHELDAAAPPELEAICKRAMARQRADRFPSAAELGREIRDWLEGRVVHSYEEGAFAELRKWVSRNRALAAALGAALLSLFLGLGSTVYVKAAAADRELGLNEDLRAANAVEKRVSDFLVGLFEASTPEERRGEKEPTAGELLDRGAEKVREELEEDVPVRARLMVAIGRAYRSLGQHENSEPLLREALTLANGHYGRGHPSTIDPISKLALLLYDRALYEEAETLLVPALVIARRDLPPDHAATLEVTNLLGIVYERLGRLDEAERLLVESIAGRERTYGVDHVDTLSAVNNLATVRTSQGRHVEARALEERVLAKWQEIHGEDHPYTLRAHANLGNSLLVLGETRAARDHLEIALAGCRRNLGDDHTQTLETMVHLALAHQRLGSNDRAAELALDSLPRLREQSPAGSSLIVIGTMTLAEVYVGWTRPEDGIALYQEALEMAAEVPIGNQTMVNLHLGLGLAQLNAGRREDAVPHLQRSFELASGATGQGEIPTSTIEHIAKVLLRAQCGEEALRWAEMLVARTRPGDGELVSRQSLLADARAAAEKARSNDDR